MNLLTKSLAVLSAVFLLAACETAPATLPAAKTARAASATGGPVIPGTQEDLDAECRRPRIL